MTKVRKLGLCLVLFSAGLSVWWGCYLGWSLSRGPLDFQAVYYGSRTLLQHHNPYSVNEVAEVYRAEGGLSQSANARQYQDMTLYVNTPATLLFVAPLAILPLATGQVVWMIFTAGSLTFAAFLIWDLAALDAPILSGCLVCFLLINCQVVFGGGNSAGIVIGLCVVGAWCFVKGIFLPAGILCMAVSLLIKPHDAGLVWLYFLLVGGVYRKRALQSAIVTASLALLAVLWISHIVPHWLHDWNSNMAVIAAPGGINDPRPAALTNITADNVISLQAVFSIFHDDPRFYNLASYLMCGVPLVVWVISTLRLRFSPKRIWIALAVIAPLTVLVTYHRVHDTKLLLLAIPACAMLWAGRGPIGWAASVLTAAAVVVNADIPLAILSILTDHLHLSTATLSGQILTILIARPNQLILLAMSLFYLWVYIRDPHASSALIKRKAPEGEIESSRVPSQAHG